MRRSTQGCKAVHGGARSYMVACTEAFTEVHGGARRRARWRAQRCTEFLAVSRLFSSAPKSCLVCGRRLRCRPSQLSSAQLLVVVVVVVLVIVFVFVFCFCFSSSSKSCLVCRCRLRCRLPIPAGCAGAACVAGQPPALQAKSCLVCGRRLRCRLSKLSSALGRPLQMRPRT